MYKSMCAVSQRKKNHRKKEECNHHKRERDTEDRGGKSPLQFFGGGGSILLLSVSLVVVMVPPFVDVKKRHRDHQVRERGVRNHPQKREREEEPPHGERWRHRIATKRKNKGGLSPSLFLCGVGGAFSTLSLCNGGSFLLPLSQLWCGRLSRPSTTQREKWTVHHHIKTMRRRP